MKVRRDNIPDRGDWPKARMSLGCVRKKRKNQNDSILMGRGREIRDEGQHTESFVGQGQG